MARHTLAEKFGAYWAKWWMSFEGLEKLDYFDGRVSVFFCCKTKCPVFGGKAAPGENSIRNAYCVKSKEDMFVPFVSYVKDTKRSLDKERYPINVGLWNLALPGEMSYSFVDHNMEKLLTEYEEQVCEAFNERLTIGDLPFEQWDAKIRSNLVLGFPFVLEGGVIATCVLELTCDEIKRLGKIWKNSNVRLSPGESVENVLKNTFKRLYKDEGWDMHFMKHFFEHYAMYRTELIQKGYGVLVTACT